MKERREKGAREGARREAENEGATGEGEGEGEGEGGRERVGERESLRRTERACRFGTGVRPDKRGQSAPIKTLMREREREIERARERNSL